MYIKYMMRMAIDKKYQQVVDDDKDECENFDLMLVDDDRTLETMNRMLMVVEQMHSEFVEVLLAMFDEMMD